MMDYLLKSTPDQIKSDVNRMIGERGVTNDQINQMRGNLESIVNLLNLQ